MFERIKNSALTLVTWILWLRFALVFADPQILNNSLSMGLPIFTQWRNVIDPLYTVSGYLVTPVYEIYTRFLANMVPQNEWFPGMMASAVMIKLQAATSTIPQATVILENPMVKAVFQGYLDWLTLVALAGYMVLGALVEPLFDFARNVFWNIFIEMSYTRKKQTLYQEKLEQRALDISKLKNEYKSLSKEASQLATSAVTDEMTQLYNKRFFVQTMGQIFQEAKQKHEFFTLVMVDIDHFKRLNDTYGHLMGDIVLQQVARVLKDNCPKDCYACRFGGEEFALIMPGKRNRECMPSVEDIHRAIPTLRFEEDPNLRVTISMGVVSLDLSQPDARDVKEFTDAIKLADDELYRAKTNGRNRIECRILETSEI
ncbi:MAG: GGDEF domain-containing protein [Candidatus Melainabacteria bacterium]